VTIDVKFTNAIVDRQPMSYEIPKIEPLLLIFDNDAFQSNQIACQLHFKHPILAAISVASTGRQEDTRGEKQRMYIMRQWKKLYRKMRQWKNHVALM
jgi:hypothetical protein